MTAIWKAQEVAVIDLSGASDLVAVAWRANRAYLIDLAYRMLGDIGGRDSGQGVPTPGPGRTRRDAGSSRLAGPS
jgi:hypothetical protein